MTEAAVLSGKHLTWVTWEPELRGLQAGTFFPQWFCSIKISLSKELYLNSAKSWPLFENAVEYQSMSSTREAMT